jgi:DAACS family dicarboxylate/amino acid:cation (Na+ or H+) symporter
MAESIGNKGKGMKLHTKILLGLLVGAVVGIAANQLLGGDHPAVEFVNKYLANPVGQIFLRLLFMIVIPLVFASIALGVAGLGDLRRVGRVGGKAIAYFLASTALAATLGLVAISIVRPGEQLDRATAEQLRTEFAGDASSRVEAAASTDFGVNTIINMFSRNPVRSAVDLDMLGIITFALIFGAALTLIAAERAKPMLSWLEALQDVVIKIVEIAMLLAPYGVAGLIFGVTSRFGFHLLQPLGAYVFVVMGALLLHVLLNLSLILRFLVGINPFLFYRRVRAALVTAFSTSSSAATLPTALAVAEQNLGIPPSVAGFVLPLGSTMCMNGTALFEGMTVIFLAQVFGVDLTLGQMIVVMIMSVLTAVGAAGVPGGSIPLLVTILVMFGIPAEGIAIVLGVDRILDMSRTTVNVCGDLSATAFVARSERVWDASRVPVNEEGAIPHVLDDSPGWPPPADMPTTEPPTRQAPTPR